MAEAARADAAPMEGCYERLYDVAHLSAHKDQFVVRASLSIKPATAEQKGDAQHGIVANANLKIWVRGRKKGFDTLGACEMKGDVLDCGGSISAAETEVCAGKRAGVHDCRIDMGDAGGFEIEKKPGGVLVTVPDRLDLAQPPYDGGPFLNLIATDSENRSFLLNPSADACK